jgi:type II secretory pathway pseudopilin PulG
MPGAASSGMDAMRPAIMNDNRAFWRSFLRTGGRAGATLVEVLLSCLILAIVAIACVQYLYFGQAGLAVQKNRRIALQVAHSRLEDVLAAPYTLLPLPANTNVYNVRKTSTNTFVVGSNETVVIGVTTQRIVTTFQGVALPGGSPADMLRVTVSVDYQANMNDQVVLQTMKSP